MGQYLAIGVTYEIHVNKANSVKRVEDLGSLKNELNQEYNPTDIYDLHVHGDNVVLTLKDDILLEEWTAVLETFYKLRYRNWSDDGNVLKVLKETNNPIIGFQTNTSRCFPPATVSESTANIIIKTTITMIIYIILKTAINGKFRRHCIP